MLDFFVIKFVLTSIMKIYIHCPFLTEMMKVVSHD